MKKTKTLITIFSLKLLISYPAISETIYISTPDLNENTSIEITHGDLHSISNSQFSDEITSDKTVIKKIEELRGDRLYVNKDSKKTTIDLDQSNHVGSLITASAASSTPPQYSFNDCTAFTLGTGLQATHESEGQIKCFNTYSPNQIKLEAQASSQPNGVNYDLFLYYYNHNTGSVEFKASSLATGNDSDFATSVMPAGNYVIYTRATSSSSTTPFVVGALGFSGYDLHEANENLATATRIAGNRVLTGNTDHASDIDYFLYTTDEDQSELDVSFIAENHLLQYYNSNGGWTNFNSSGFTAFATSPNSNYYFRVVNIKETNDPLVNYELALTRKAEFIGDPRVTNDETLNNVCCGLDAYSRINFKGYAQDLNRRTVPYGKVLLRVFTIDGQIVTKQVTTDRNGYFEETLNFTPCEGGGYFGQGSKASNPPSFWYLGMTPQTFGLGFFQHCTQRPLY